MSGYPPDWAEIARRCKERAGWRCEHCGGRHGEWGSRGKRGEFYRIDPAAMRRLGHHGKPPFRRRLSRGGFVRVVELVVQAAHLDGEPSHCEDANLACLCKYCHLAYDLQQHLRNAAATRRRKMATGDLFAGGG